MSLVTSPNARKGVAPHDTADRERVLEIYIHCYLRSLPTCFSFPLVFPLNPAHHQPLFLNINSHWFLFANGVTTLVLFLLAIPIHLMYGCFRSSSCSVLPPVVTKHESRFIPCPIHVHVGCRGRPCLSDLPKAIQPKYECLSCSPLSLPLSLSLCPSVYSHVACCHSHLQPGGFAFALQITTGFTQEQRALADHGKRKQET